MFSIAGLGKQLKSAAEGFEQAGHAIQARAAAAQQQVAQNQSNTPQQPSSPVGKGKRLDLDNEGGSRRGSGEVTRPAGGALASRLSSLVARQAAAAGASGSGISRPGSADSLKEIKKQPERTASKVETDPVNIPLPPSPELAPVNLPTSPPPDNILLSPDSNRSSSLFNTPRNPAARHAPAKISIGDIEEVGDSSKISGEAGRDVNIGERTSSETFDIRTSTEGESAQHAFAETENLVAAADRSAKVENFADIPHVSTSTADEGSDGGEELEEEDLSGLSREELESRLKDSSAKAKKANRLFRRASPLLSEGLNDFGALEGWVKMVKGKADMGAGEAQRLQAKLALQSSKIEEIQETHRLEQTSSTALIKSLRDQLAQNESSLSSQATTSLQLAQTTAELATSQQRFKDTDEKLGKAVNLLKTVRSKLVNATRDREEAAKALDAEKDEVERLKESLDQLRADKEKEVQGLRQAFDKENQNLREKHERETLAEKRKWELEMITMKATHAKDLATKTKQINSLNDGLRELNEEKRRQFELLQSRQEQVESATSAKESYEARMKELAHQAKEAQDRASLAEEALAEARRGQANTSAAAVQAAPASGNAEDVTRLLAEANSKAESRLNELRSEIGKLERERLDMEEEHTRQLRSRGTEIERMRGLVNDKDREVGSALRSRSELEQKATRVEKEKEALRLEMEDLQASLADSREAQARAIDVEATARQDTEILQEHIQRLSTELEDAKQGVIQAKNVNRNLREEMRKLQSSVQLLEKQRNPGVGYWAASNGNSATPGPGRSGNMTPDPASTGRVSLETGRRTANAASSPAPAQPVSSSPVPSEAGPRNEEEEVNLEYLRNVILQFLEHKEMRPNLVRVLSVILHFTPQELRRLNAKLSA